jgi:hypothetical protein
VNDTATLEVGNVTLNQALALNNGSTLRGTGAFAKSTAVTTVAAGAAVSLQTGPSVGDVLTIGDTANDLTGGAGATLTIGGLGKVVLAEASNYAGAITIPEGTTLEAGAYAAAGNSGLGTGTVTLDGGTLKLRPSMGDLGTGGFWENTPTLALHQRR